MPTLIPHPFMGLDTFMAERIYQMPAGKSYLAHHPNWGEKDPDTTSPACQKDKETFEHTISYCEVKV